MEWISAECFFIAVQQLNPECFGHLYSYGSDLKKTPQAMVMPPPVNQNSEVCGRLSRKYCQILKDGMQLYTLLLNEDRVFGSGWTI